MDLAVDRFSPERFGLITGSACHVLFPVRSAKVGQDTYARKLANEKYFRFYDEQSTWQTEHGNYSEHSAFEYFQRYYNKDIEKGYFVKEGEFGGTSDALCPEFGIDFKCPTTLKAYIDYLYDGISDQQLHQAQMYMHLFKKDYWHIVAYLTETFRMTEMGLTYPIPLDKRMIVVVIKKQHSWIDRLMENSIPLLKDRDMYYNKLIEHFGMPSEQLTID